MTDLVVVSLEAWDDVWRRNQHLVAGLLRSDAALRVLFVEPPADPTHDLRSRGVRRSRVGCDRGSGCRARPAVHGATGEVAAPPARPARRRAPRAGRDARRRLARHAASAALDQRPRRGRARRAVGLADAVRHHRRLARGRPAGGRARACRRERGAPARPRPRGGGVLARAGAPQGRDPAGRRSSPTPSTPTPTAAPRRRPADLPDGPVALYLGTVHPDRIDVDLCEATARALGDGRHARARRAEPARRRAGCAAAAMRARVCSARARATR